MSLKLFFWLTSVTICCIVSISAIQPLPTELRHCKNLYTSKSERPEFVELSLQNMTNLLLEFYVIGTSDCHVHLSPIGNPVQTNYDGLYDFLIGGFNNSRTVVRHGRKILRDFRTENVLSESQPVQIRIETAPSGIIRIFHNNAELVTAHQVGGLSPIRYFRFATDQTDGMEFYYDCMKSAAPNRATQNSMAIYVLILMCLCLMCHGYVQS